MGLPGRYWKNIIENRWVWLADTGISDLTVQLFIPSEFVEKKQMSGAQWDVVFK